MISKMKSMSTNSMRMKLTGIKCTDMKSSGTRSINSVRQMQAHYTRHSQGFTLMEIIVVVILIGAIVAFAASRILGGSDRAKFNLAKAQVETLASKIDQYKEDVGALPPSLDALVKQPSGAASWLGPYAKPEELKDPWQHALVYKVPGDGAPYSLICLGKDGQPGGTSTDQDIVHQ
jgi:general secretion pathway protein G